MTAPVPKSRWFHPRLNWVLFALFAVEGFLFVSAQVGWFGFNEDIVVTAAIAVAAVIVVPSLLILSWIVLLLFWIAARLAFSRPFQFSLRSLMLFVLGVALLCSLGKCTHWLVPVVLAATGLIGGIAGSLVAGIKAGFVEGALYGILFFLFAFVGCARLVVAFPGLGDVVWRLFSMICGIALLIGGILGGYSVRPRSGP